VHGLEKKKKKIPTATNNVKHIPHVEQATHPTENLLLK